MEGRGNAVLKTIDLLGGSPRTLCELPGASASGGAWNRDNVILFGSIGNGPLRRTEPSSGGCAPVTALDASAHETSHIYPSFLPDGRHFLYVATAQADAARRAAGTFVGSLDSSERKLLVRDGVYARYANDRIIYQRDRTILVKPFDAKRLVLTGEAVPLTSDMLVGGSSGFAVGGLSVSENGLLAYQAGSGDTQNRLTWIDRTGKELGVVGDRANYSFVAIGPDGTRVAVSIVDPVQRQSDVWTFDARGLGARLTDASAQAAVWSPDGTQVVFSAARGDLYVKHATASRDEELLFADARRKTPLHWSRDGRRIMYSTLDQQTGQDLWILDLDTKKARPFRATRFQERSGSFSPDGRWVAYTSDVSGQTEVWVGASDGSEEAIRVSSAGGDEPKWRRDGEELFYWANNTLMAVSVNGRGPAVEVRPAQPLFERGRKSGLGASYDVDRDGQRFLVNTIVQESAPITLLVNWPAMLKKQR